MIKNFFLSTLIMSFLLCNTITAKEEASIPSKSESTQQELSPEELEMLQQLQKQQEVQQKELIEGTMSQLRLHMEEIGFCVQQLQQTIQARKIKFSKKQTIHILSELQVLQQNISLLMDQAFKHVTPEATIQGTILCNCFVDFLLATLTKGLEHIDTNKIESICQKRFEHYTKVMNEKKLIALTKVNDKKIKELTKVTDTIGITWYNFLYRKFEKNKIWEKTKTSITLAILPVTIATIATVLLRPAFQRFMPKQILDKTEGIEQAEYNGKPYLEEGATLAATLGFSYLSLKELGILESRPLLNINDFVIQHLGPHWKSFKDYTDKTLRSYQDAARGTHQKISSDKQKIYFKDMVGAEHLEDLAHTIANFMKHPDRYERSDIDIHRGILLYGPPQTGKTLFAKALKTLIEEEIGKDSQIKFIDANYYMQNNPAPYNTIEWVFGFASYHAPAIIFFDEMDMLGAQREKNSYTTSQLLTCMAGVDDFSKQVIVIGATNRPEQLDFALTKDGRFGKQIRVDYPTYTHRKELLTRELNKRSIQIKTEFIDHIAQETDGCSYNELKRIVTEALGFSSRDQRMVKEADFEKALDLEIRNIQPASGLPESTKKIIATSQAGKAVARHILKTKKEVVKITINPVAKRISHVDGAVKLQDNDTTENDKEKPIYNQKYKTKNGEVFTKSTIDETMYSDTDAEHECIALLAGEAATQVILNENFSQCNTHDRAIVMNSIESMLSHGGKINDAIREKAIKVKNEYIQKAITLLTDNKKLLETIIEALLKNNTINRYQWKELITELDKTPQEITSEK